MKTVSSALLAISILAVASGAAAQAPSPAKPAEASIPFVNYGGIRDWRAVDSNTLYVQDRSRNWYKADLFGPCIDLPFANAIGFETRGIDSFDKFSSVVVRGQRCTLRSLVRSDAPPSRKGQRRS